MQLSPEVSHLVARLIKQVAGVREERKVWALVLRAMASHFGASGGTILLFRRGEARLCKVKSIGREPSEPEATLLDFFFNRKPELQGSTIMAPVRAGNLVVGVIVFERSGGFRKGVGREATEVLKLVGRWVGCRRQLAERESECAIGNAVIGHVAPKDVIYRILHQVRRFIDYDHGATVLGVVDGATARVAARQVAWTKGKSDLVGRTVPVAWKAVSSAPACGVLSPDESPHWAVLEGLREEGAPPKRSIMTASIAAGGRVIGLVEVSSRRDSFFLDKDAATLSRFLPYMAWCMKRIHDDPESTGGCHG